MLPTFYICRGYGLLCCSVYVYIYIYIYHLLIAKQTIFIIFSEFKGQFWDVAIFCSRLIPHAYNYVVYSSDPCAILSLDSLMCLFMCLIVLVSIGVFVYICCSWFQHYLCRRCLLSCKCLWHCEYSQQCQERKPCVRLSRCDRGG